ncbi:CCR4-NOT transcription complex subunit 1 like protein [Verticillium longisporum]|uniref:CCR4-NOT transcription complex subunit 1 like protein n=1 Tax=Verticillium longisporum TaxID=100787 RepID=A0A8I2ZGE7_VERLO|nr:CCR4-NOT transcription complex subunit 1 like protein [Verticillium longisporum]
MLLRIASRLADLSPRYLPGFAYGWLSLIQHRAFLPAILKERAGWSAYTTLLRMLFEFVGQQLKAPEPTAVARDTYRATLKLLVVLQHDFTEYIAAHSDQLRMSLPPHCKQLINAILAANPASQDALSPNADQSNGSKAKETTEDDTAILLREHGLLGVVDQALHTGPSEDGLAHMTRAINESDARETGFAHVSIKANLSVIEAIILHVGKYAVGRLAQGGESFNPSSTDVAVLSLLMHELAPEPRYYLIVGMVNQLRFPGDMTSYFSRVLLEIFGRDLNDPDDTEIRQQITRVLWERLIGFWPQPWGLMITVLELLKNEKYAFFDLPFVKSSPEIIDRFHAVLQLLAMAGYLHPQSNKTQGRR